VDVDVPAFNAAMTDNEYRAVLSVLEKNLNEPSELAEELAWLNYKVGHDSFTLPSVHLQWL
jgi:hypothetical protein